ncbi:CPSF30, partial [Symbiodinium pilosum]
MDLSFASLSADPDDWDEEAPPPPRTQARGAPSSPVRVQSPRGPPPSKIHGHPGTRYFVIKSSSHKNLVLSIEHK